MMMTMMCVALVAASLNVVVGATGRVNDYYYSHWCGQGLPYLDDSKCAKVFPSVWDLEASCGVPQAGPVPAGYAREAPFDAIQIDWQALSAMGGAELDGVSMGVTLVRRQPDGLYVRYLASGDGLDPHETWSSSKIFSMANGAGSIEMECGLGLDSSVRGEHGTTLLGDLATIICSYDETQGYTSNSLAKYFAYLGGQLRFDALLHEWAKLPANHTMGGSYGEQPPPDLGSTVYNASGSGQGCDAGFHPMPNYVDNQLSQLAHAELLRRLALHRETSQPFPGMTWGDARAILYGASNRSLMFTNSTLWGGMSADTAIFVQSGLNMTRVEELSQGRWRIHSKLGAGYSNDRNAGEIVTNAYVCLPNAADGGTRPLEFTLSARVSVPQDSTLALADTKLQAAVATIVSRLFSAAASDEEQEQ